jgi:two-component system NtrC family response regulator
METIVSQPNLKREVDFQKSSAASILIIDDNELWRDSAARLCGQIFSEIGGFVDVVHAANSDLGLEALTRQEFQVVLLDKELVDGVGRHTDGIELIPEILRIQPQTQLLIFTGEDDPRYVVKAMHLGASGYLLKEGKPGHDAYRMAQLRQAFSRAKEDIERARLNRTLETSQEEFVALSPSMRRLVHHLESLAGIPLPVLFLGAAGLGKGAATRKLHQIRAKLFNQISRPFFNINLASLSGADSINELFGNEMNSSSGTRTQVKQGYFELASNGDIVLDEVGDASPELQARLIKVIERHQFQRQGGSRYLTTNARLIFATNKCLKKMVEEGTFREDLYMRISALTIQLPPLEERKEDLPELIRTILNRINKYRSDPVVFEDLPSDFVNHLMRDNIPGNIRGLENDLSRVIVFCPKDNRNRPNFVSWKNCLGIGKNYVPALQATSSSLTLEQFKAMQTDFIRPGFNGLQDVRDLLEKKLLQEAERKLPTNVARAQALKINPGHLSRKYSFLNQDNAETSGNEAKSNKKGNYGKRNK